MGEGKGGAVAEGGGQRHSGRPAAPSVHLPSPQWPGSRRRSSARVTRPGLFAPPAPRLPPPAPGPGHRGRAALRLAARGRGSAAVALAARVSLPARGARARRPPSPSRLAGGGAVLPGRPHRSLGIGGVRQPGRAEARGAGRRRRGGHDRGAERAAAERGAEAPADIF